MSKAKLYTGSQGVFGGRFSKYQAKGCIVIAIDGELYDATRITIDAFKGMGNSYERRDNSHILITDQGKDIFNGTREEFINVLKFGVELRDFGKENK